MIVLGLRPWTPLPSAGELGRVVAAALRAAAAAEGHRVTQVEHVGAHAALRLNAREFDV